MHGQVSPLCQLCINAVKGLFRDSQPHPPIFWVKKSEMFTSADAFTYGTYVCVQNISYKFICFGEIISQNSLFAFILFVNMST